VFKKHFVADPSTIVLLNNTEYELLSDKRAVLMGMKLVLNGQEITDFGEIEHPSQETISSHVQTLLHTYKAPFVQYDFIREDSPTFQLLAKLTSFPPILKEVSPFIILPTTWDAYLESLERTNRKELKRKLNRLNTTAHRFRSIDKPSDTAFEEFIRLHRLSDSSKSAFMTEGMKSFFYDLYTSHFPAWNMQLVFLDIEDKPAASLLYFENNEEVLLYNSGYDPAYKFYSAGLLLCAHLIQQGIEKKKMKFDFLRGNERYKYDLGGVDCKLYQFMFT